MKALVAIALGLLLLAGVTAAPADDPEVPERYIKVVEARPLLDQKPRAVFIDVRPRPQYEETHIPGALSIPLSDLPGRVAEVPRNIRVILY